MNQRGLKALCWLTQLQMSEKGHFRPIGSNEVYRRGGARANFDQLPSRRRVARVRTTRPPSGHATGQAAVLHRVLAQFAEQCRQDESAGVIVGAIAFGKIRNAEYRSEEHTSELQSLR